MPTLRINTGLPRVIFEPLFGGGYVPPTQSNVICVLIANELYIDSGRLAFHTLVKIPKTETENEADAKALAIGCVESELPLTLSKHGYWDFYRTTELNLPSRDCRVTKPRLGQVEVALELHEGIHRQATDTLSHLIGLEQRFEQAKKRLWDHAANNYPLGFAQSLPEARELLRFIERVLEDGADLGGYEPNKARSALRCYEELARRKVENNFKYQHARESLKSFTFGVTFPRTWARRPDA